VPSYRAFPDELGKGPPVLLFNTVTGDSPAGAFAESYTSGPFVSVPLDTPVQFIWGLLGRGETGCNTNGGQGEVSMTARATLGDINADIFALTNVVATDGGGVVDITSVEGSISGGRFSPAVPAGDPIVWWATALMLGTCGV
jgi:hypothetical protein